MADWPQLAKALYAFILTSNGGKTEDTTRTYVAAISLFYRWCPVHEACPETADKPLIEAYIADLRKRVSNFTARNHVYALRCFYAYCIDRGLRCDDPTVGIHVKKPKALPKPDLTTNEQRRLIFGATSLRDQAMWAFLADTGLRIGECVRLNLEDVRWRDQLVRVYGKGDKVRDVPFSDQTAELLIAYVGNRRSGPLFVTKDGNRMRRDGARKNFYKLSCRVRVQAYPHQLRITFANRFLQNGGQLDELQELMGHADLSTTAHYAGASKRDRAIDRARSMNLVGRLFD